MPSLPRIRARSRDIAREVSAPPARQPAELAAHGLTWIHLDSPTTEEATALAEHFGWHPLDVEDVVSKRQRPKVDEYDDYRFVVLHFPVYDKAARRLNAGELDVFLGPDYLVTLPTVELLPVTRLFQRASDDPELRDSLFSKGSGYLLYHVLDDLFDYCFPILDKIGHKLDSIEDDIEDERSSHEIVRDISRAKQEIISYRKIVKPQRPTLRLLERHVERFLPQDLELYFDDLVDASERIWDILDNYKEVVEALEATNESAISHRQNDVLRVLTVFSAVLLPLTLLASIFGMNVDFPGSGNGRRVLGDGRRHGCRVRGTCSASSAGGAGSAQLVICASLLVCRGGDRAIRHIRPQNREDAAVTRTTSTTRSIRLARRIVAALALLSVPAAGTTGLGNGLYAFVRADGPGPLAGLLGARLHERQHRLALRVRRERESAAGGQSRPADTSDAAERIRRQQCRLDRDHRRRGADLARRSRSPRHRTRSSASTRATGRRR